MFCLPCSSFVVAVKWHPKNPNLLLVACEKGVVELWNVLKDREVLVWREFHRSVRWRRCA